MSKLITRSELLNLLSDLTLDQLSAEGKARLEEAVAGDERARLIYLEFMAQHVRLRELAGTLPSVRIRTKEAPERPRRSAVPLAITLAAACLLLVAVGLYLRPQETTPSGQILYAGTSVALRGEFDEDNAMLSSGARIEVGNDVARIRMSSGADLVFEGPGVLELLGENAVRLQRGILSVSAGDSIGFSVETSSGKFIDLGTKFTVMCNEQAGVELHVISGKVEYHGVSSKVAFSAGEACRLPEGEASLVSTVADTKTFLDPAGFDQQLASDTSTVDMLAQRRRMRFDPDLLLLYTFDPDSIDGGLIYNQAIQRKDFAVGLVEGVELVEGVLPGDTALRFNPDLRLSRVSVDKETSQNFRAIGRPMTVTIAFRLPSRKDTLGREQHLVAKAGMLGSNWGIRALQDEQDGGCRLKLDYWGAGAPEIITEPVIDDNQWHTATATFTPREGKTDIRFYVDGKLAGQAIGVTGREEANPVPLVVGSRYKDRQAENRSRHMMTGDITELSIWRKALNDEEIRELHQVLVPEQPKAPGG